MLVSEYPSKDIPEPVLSASLPLSTFAPNYSHNTPWRYRDFPPQSKSDNIGWYFLTFIHKGKDSLMLVLSWQTSEKLKLFLSRMANQWVVTSIIRP